MPCDVMKGTKIVLSAHTMDEQKCRGNDVRNGTGIDYIGLFSWPDLIFKPVTRREVRSKMDEDRCVKRVGMGYT